MKEINLAPAEDPEAAAAVAEAVKKEICVHKLLDHENVVRCYGSRMERTRQFIFLEYCSGGELFDRIGEQEFLERDIHFDRPPAILSPHCGGCYGKNTVLRAKCQLSFNCQTFSPSTFSLASRAAYLPKKSLFQARDFSLLIFLLLPSSPPAVHKLIWLEGTLGRKRHFPRNTLVSPPPPNGFHSFPLLLPSSSAFKSAPIKGISLRVILKTLSASASLRRGSPSFSSPRSTFPPPIFCRARGGHAGAPGAKLLQAAHGGNREYTEISEKFFFRAIIVFFSLFLTVPTCVRTTIGNPRITFARIDHPTALYEDGRESPHLRSAARACVLSAQCSVLKRSRRHGTPAPPSTSFLSTRPPSPPPILPSSLEVRIGCNQGRDACSCIHFPAPLAAWFFCTSSNTTQAALC